MKQQARFISIFTCLFFLVNCKNPTGEFIANFGDNNFEAYTNVAVYFRSADENGDNIFFFDYLSDSCQSPFIVLIDRDTKRVKEIRSMNEKTACNVSSVESAKIADLTERFLQYKIVSLKVDKDGVVFINFNEHSNSGIIRVSKSELYKYCQNCYHIEGDWYSREQ
ncbi:MAG: hypothetical protein ACK5DD_05635 [Cyclobacteriaceae bacterium]|jgi:hypothetical protein